jgi:pilus assembly protein CpaE
VIGRDNEIGSYRRFKKLGVFEYLVSPIDAEDLAHSLEDYKREAIARGDAIDPSKVLVVTGARGGLGTSTIAAALAQGIASKHDKRVLLLDLDLETGCQYVINNTEPTEGFGLMLEQPRNVDSLLLNRTLAKPMHNLFLLSDAAPEIYGRIAPDAATLLIAQSYRDMDVVVVDLPVRSIFAAQMLANAGTIVMVTAPTLYGLRDAMALADQAEKGQVETPLLAINRVGEVRNGAVPLSTFRQKLAKGARPDFRNALDGGIFEIPYAAKTAQLFAHRNETLLNDTGALGRSLQALLSRLPTAPQHSRRERSFVRMLLGS